MCQCEETKGGRINRCASLSSQFLSLQEGLERAEKEARKTPPKTLKGEWEKVRKAKENLSVIQRQIEAVVEELILLCPLVDWYPTLLIAGFLVEMGKAIKVRE
jgi:hypothetical protein